MDIPKWIREYEGKKESAHIWVLYGYNKDKFIEELQGKLDTAKNIKDPVIRSNVNNTYYNLLLELTDNKKLTSRLDIIIYSTPGNMEIINLTKRQISNLNTFKCRNQTHISDNTFDIDWLDHYLNDDTYVNMITVNVNTFKHYRLNLTKKTCVHEDTNKSMTVTDYVTSHVGTEPYILCGSSVKLKNFDTTTDGVIIFEPKLLTPDEAYLAYDKHLNHQNIIRVEEIVKMLNNEKEIERVVIGKKSNGSKLENGYLEELYCYRKLYNALQKNMIKNNIKVGTKIVAIDYDPKDVITHVLKPYDGIIGLSYDWAANF